MNKTRNRVIHVGDKSIYERTDPDYEDKRLAQLAKDYAECPKEWQGEFLVGLSAKDRQELLQRLGVFP